LTACSGNLGGMQTLAGVLTADQIRYVLQSPIVRNSFKIGTLTRHSILIEVGIVLPVNLAVCKQFVRCHIHIASRLSWSRVAVRSPKNQGSASRTRFPHMLDFGRFLPINVYCALLKRTSSTCRAVREAEVRALDPPPTALPQTSRRCAILVTPGAPKKSVKLYQARLRRRSN